MLVLLRAARASQIVPRRVGQEFQSVLRFHTHSCRLAFVFPDLREDILTQTEHQENYCEAAVGQLKCGYRLKVFGSQSGSSSDACQHARPDFILIVKGENDIRPAKAGENLVRTAGFPLYRPADAEQGGQNSSGFG